MKALIPVIRLPAATIAAIFSVWLAQIAPVAAGYDEGVAAFIRGDYEVAWQEWQTLGERGHQSAQYNLGVLYSIGLGVEQDEEEASKWFRRAADRGLPAAQMRLGSAYLEGKGVPRDSKEAYFWFSLAASHFSLGEQHQQAVAARESSGAGLTRAQITKVLERAMNWRPVQQTIDESEKERLIAAPAGEDLSNHRDGDSNGVSSNGTGPEASPSQTAVAQIGGGGEATNISDQDAQTATPAAEIAASTETPAKAAQSTPAKAAQSDADASHGQAAAGQEPGDLPSAETASDGTGKLETSAPGAEQAEAGEEGESAAEDLAIELATATETGGSHAAGTAPSPDPAAQEPFAAHLSSVRSSDGTETEWQKLQALFPGLLNGRTLTVRRIELAEQGTFYRVMAGPFADYDAAEELCAQLKTSDQYCAVRRLDEGPSQ